MVLLQVFWDWCHFQKNANIPFIASVCPITPPAYRESPRSELKFHGNAGDNAHGKIQSEYLGPKPDGFVVLFIPGPQRTPLPVHKEPGIHN
jgi:hypothetical protein